MIEERWEEGRKRRRKKRKKRTTLIHRHFVQGLSFSAYSIAFSGAATCVYMPLTCVYLLSAPFYNKHAPPLSSLRLSSSPYFFRFRPPKKTFSTSKDGCKVLELSPRRNQHRQHRVREARGASAGTSKPFDSNGTSIESLPASAATAAHRTREDSQGSTRCWDCIRVGRVVLRGAGALLVVALVYNLC